jgi:MFS family permease
VTTQPTSSAGTGGRRPLILVVCCLAQFLGVLDMTVVNVALAAIRADLGFSTTGLQWVVSAYTLSCAGFLLLGGRAADLFGRREVFCAGLTLFGLASLAGGLAQEPVMLIGARAVQGLGGAVMVPTSLSILANVFDEGAARNRAFGLWGTLGALGGASGALVGGLVMEALSWRWILLVNAPLALGVALVAWQVIPARGHRAGRSFDLAGAITVTAGLVLVTYAVVGSHRHGWASVATLAPLLGGLDLLALFALIEAYVVRAPLVPPRVVRSRALVGANVAAMCLGGAAISMWFLLSLYVQQALGYSPLRAGLTFLPMSLTIVACTQAAGRLAARVGPRPGAGVRADAAGRRPAAVLARPRGRARAFPAVRGRHRVLVRLGHHRRHGRRAARGLGSRVRPGEHVVSDRRLGRPGRAGHDRCRRSLPRRLRGRQRPRAVRCRRGARGGRGAASARRALPGPEPLRRAAAQTARALGAADVGAGPLVQPEPAEERAALGHVSAATSL